MKYKNCAYLAAVFLLLSLCGCGEEASAPLSPERGASYFTVSETFCDGCVLQRDEPITINGFSDDEGAYVYATLGASVAQGLVKDGRWSVTFAPRTYCAQPQTMHFYGGPQAPHIYIEDVLIGDVWFIIGQSNVEYTLLSSSDCDNVCAAVPESSVIRIRALGSAAELERSAASSPQERLPYGAMRWKSLSKYNVRSFSALGANFALKLNAALGGEIPLGIVTLGFSGKGITSFLPREIALSLTRREERSIIYNTYIAPLEKVKIKGVVWYQGETDEISSSAYTEALSSLIEHLRAQKEQLFPVYMVELPPCFETEGGQYMPFGTVRAMQGAIPMQCVRTFMCPTSDLWSDREYSNNLHPDNKGAVAARLALMITSREYGFGNTEHYFAPTLASASYSGEDERAVELTFDNVGAAIESDGDIRGFEVIGSDWKILDASIEITGADSVTIRAREKIYIVRYNARSDDVFGDSLSMRSSFGSPLCAFSITLCEIENAGTLFKKLVSL